MSNRHLTRCVAAALLFVPLLAGCSDAEDDAEGIATEADGSGSATSGAPDQDTDAGDGGDSAGVEAPIMIEGPESVSVTVGDALDVITEDVTEVRTDDPDVLEVSQPSDDGSAQFNAGASVVGAGEATLSVYGEGGEKLYDVSVTAEG
jgi:hypothetical protein